MRDSRGLSHTTHPDWRSLLAHRFEADAAEPDSETWAEAMAHFDSCPECRRSAVAIDPTLGFRRLPSVAAEMSAAQEADEVARMISAVSALRAERRVTRRAEGRPLVRWSAAAALVLVALGVGALGGGVRNPAKDFEAAQDRSTVEARPSTGIAPASSDLEAPSDFAPRVGLAVEGIDRPEARVYQYDGDQLSVVMIVDESLDV